MREIETRRWTLEEYYRMAETGVLARDERVELIEGEILKMSPQGSPHLTAIHRTLKALFKAFGFEAYVRVQGPLVLGPFSEPEPDLALVPGSELDYSEAHPSTALLVVEVSETTIEYDRNRKGSLYARAGIAEYWVLNLVDHALEVYRDPVPSATAPYGWEYSSVQRFSAEQSVCPLHAPNGRVSVADLLP